MRGQVGWHERLWRGQRQTAYIQVLWLATRTAHHASLSEVRVMSLMGGHRTSRSRHGRPATPARRRGGGGST
jgi:hypothetical protein